MTTYTHIGTNPRLGHLRAHLRAYVVGVGATTALTAGALVAFLSVATFIAFQGLPLGGSSDDAGAAYLGANATAAPTAAAAALGAANAAVAKDPVPGSSGGSTGGHHSGGGNSPGGDLSGGGSNPPGGSGGGGDPAGSPIPGVPLLPSSSGAVTHAIQGVDNAAGTNLSGPTSGATGALDGAAGGGLNQVGGAVGHPHLGDQVGGTVNGVTDTVLGG